MSQVNRVEKLIINLDTAMALSCAWADCEKRARTPYQIRVHEHPPQYRCDLVNAAGGDLGRHSHYAFCSDRCKDFWLWSSGSRANELAARNNGRIWGMAPEGSKLGRYR